MDDDSKQLEIDSVRSNNDAIINGEQAAMVPSDILEEKANAENVVKDEENDHVRQTENIEDIHDDTAQDPIHTEAIAQDTKETIPDVIADSINAMPEAQTAISDLDLIRAQIEADAEMQKVTESEGITSGPQDELKRLRQLVLATRGSKGQLPPGWDDEAGSEQVVPGEQAQPGGEGQSSEDLVQSALKKVDATQVPDSEEDDDSNSDSSSDESSSSSDSLPSTGAGVRNGKRRGKVVMQTGYDSGDDGEGGASGAGGRGPATKNEVIEPTVDVPPYTLVPEGIDIRSLGKIHSIVDSVVVVSQDTGKAPGAQNTNGYLVPPVDRTGRVGEQEGEYSVLDTGSVLAFEDRNVLGVVFETFGSVQAPLYALRFASSAHVNLDQIQLGKPVFYVPNGSSYILTRALRAMGKGSDASNIWDEEVGDAEQEFSDDEAEAAFKKNQKAKRSGNSDKDGGKGKKRNAENAFAGQNSAQVKSSVVKHNLPARPMGSAMQPAMHRDADLSSATRSMPLPYDDDGQISSTPLPGLETSYESNVLSYSSPSTVGAPSYQHIRPRGGSSQVMRGRGRGNGRGGMIGHVNPNMNNSSSPVGANGWNTGTQMPQMLQQQAQWSGQGYPQQQQQQWQASYGQAYQQQPQMMNPQMQQYAGYAATQGYPVYTQAVEQQGVDSTNSYDPSKPLFPYRQQQQQQQQQQSTAPPQYSYGQQGWPTYPYQPQNGSPPN
ncbi:NAF1-domain-containing protein [Meira miltonrushii]|uniref:H/ACA ribonucleoprotein complex non-core subunit NAF1 n=1 Tax=Meira miltonrushii TaxID=1280837 RepID=A0A316VPK0_9BASI|nr:NAF1-domain-containing protein [Meira miltonrushii]PWN38081.1 NAF1-domain-containing protein [Meira miltonrushii]